MHTHHPARAPRLRVRYRRAVPFVLASLLLTPVTSAATDYWDGTGPSWNTIADWSTSPSATTPKPRRHPRRRRHRHLQHHHPQHLPISHPRRRSIHLQPHHQLHRHPHHQRRYQWLSLHRRGRHHQQCHRHPHHQRQYRPHRQSNLDRHRWSSRGQYLSRRQSSHH